jgi:hypothetical protein
MPNPNFLKRVAPVVVALAIGDHMLSGCGASRAETGPCFPGVVETSVSAGVHKIVLEQGHQLNDMINMNEASGAMNAKLIAMHQHAKHPYDTVLPEDTFEVCINGNNVTAGTKFSIIDK